MFETGYKRTGDIQPSRIVQQGQIGQANLAGANAFEVSESAWLRKRKKKMNKELEEKYQDSGRHHDPLLDRTGKRMKWARRLAPKATG